MGYSPTTRIVIVASHYSIVFGSWWTSWDDHLFVVQASTYYVHIIALTATATLALLRGWRSQLTIRHFLPTDGSGWNLLIVGRCVIVDCRIIIILLLVRIWIPPVNEHLLNVAGYQWALRDYICMGFLMCTNEIILFSLRLKLILLVITSTASALPLTSIMLWLG